MERIPVAGPWITEKEVEYVCDAVKTAWYSNHSKYITLFEKAFSSYVGRRYAIALPSCTSALHLSLAGIGVEPGDEVIVPDITWIATSAPISYLGATPVFADIDPQSWCLSVSSFESKITPKTKAVIVVDLYGNMPEMDSLMDVASKHGISVIEDAAQAIGSEYKGRKAGSLGLASTFSFHGTKTLTTGEGGILVTDDEEFYKRCRFLADHGRQPGKKMFWNSEVAYKYKMSNMQAALGVAQLERINELIARKREISSWYDEDLRNFPGITLNAQAEGVKNSYWMVTALIDQGYGLNKEDLIDAFGKKGIDCRPFFYPLSSLPAYAKTEQAEIAQKTNRSAYRISPYAVNLPSALSLTRDKVAHVCGCLKSILSDASRSPADKSR
jgi:perosamine synthetase